MPTKTLFAIALGLTFGLAPASAAPPSWKFVSIPDLLNVDIGDISGLPGYDGGPNSTSASWEASIAFVLDQIAAEGPDLVLVAGDVVMGRWNEDFDGRGIFGTPTGFSEEQDRVDAAADHYYAIWKQRFALRGLTTLVALGDHEIGDDPWNPGFLKADLVPTYKAAFARHFTDGMGYSMATGTGFDGTAYSVQHKDTLIVTLDVFQQQPDGSMRISVDGALLAWLDQQLAAAASTKSIRHVIVQGHAPVLVPVRVKTSSALVVRRAANSPLWQTLVARGADLYLAGEVHAMTAARDGGVQQVVHGGLMGFNPQINYLVGTVFRNKIELELKQLDIVNSGASLWQTDFLRPAENVDVTPANQAAGFRTVGTLTLEGTGSGKTFSNRTGFFQPAAVTNGSFETSIPIPPATSTPILDDWSTAGGAGALLSSEPGVPAPPDGRLNWAYLDAGARIWQNLGIVEVNNDYELTYAVGDRTTHDLPGLTLSLWTGGPGPGQIGTTLLASAPAQLPGGNGGVQANTAVFRISDPQLEGERLWLQLEAGAGPGQVLVDDVRLAMFAVAGAPGPCNDGLDNDGDGLVDFPADPGCKDASWPLENPACQDGLNNDGQQGIDFDGGASVNGGVPLDVRDPQCRNKPWKTSE